MDYLAQLHNLTWEVYDKLVEARKNREQLLSALADDFITDSLAGEKFDWDLLKTLTLHDHFITLFEAAVQELARRHWAAVVNQLRADVESIKALISEKELKKEQVKERRCAAIAREDGQVAMEALHEMRPIEGEITALHGRILTLQKPASELWGFPDAILAQAREDPYIAANPCALHAALAGLDQGRSVKVTFDERGQVSVVKT